MKKAVVIGAGFSGLAAATELSAKGLHVTLVEKHDQTGGRARTFKTEGFTFDMGPSWYWMPDVFDDYFESYGKKVSDYYTLKRLDPSYRVFWSDDQWDIPASQKELEQLFESVEAGAGKQLRAFVLDAEKKYRIAMSDLVYKPGKSILEFVDARTVTAAFSLDLFTPIAKQIRKYVQHPKLAQLLEFPSLFLGSTPQKIPALYSIMNYADIALGTWYPMGGMGEIAKAMTALAQEKGVELKLNTSVLHIVDQGGRVSGLETDQGFIPADVVVAAGDYAHMESLLKPDARNYTSKYWSERTMAPSALLFYLGINRKVKGLLHHNLFFDESFADHAAEIYTHPAWPEKPLFYACVPSITDPGVAPEGSENIFLLVPLAPGLTPDNEEIRNRYLQKLLDRIEQHTGERLHENIVYQRSYAMSDFEKDYSALRGNAYGLANTLMQTAILKPKIFNKRLSNLFYAGQLTVPGPGVPPSLISGKISAQLAQESLIA
ncbi:MAG TPA: phytoene desaturase family protein [Luteibaculaceae bacterium]|nr:phytoene desaturase family protein [Luteibaculaceae bacterium]